MNLSGQQGSLAILGLLFSLQSIAHCVPNCDDNSGLQYEAGKSYVYNLNQTIYEATKRDWESYNYITEYGKGYGIPRTRGKIRIYGNVVLTALENCELILSLNEVKMEISGDRYNEASAAQDRSVPTTSIKFTFKNGEVSNLLKEKNKGYPWTENIIRGILTMLQNKALGTSEGAPEENETNIKGDCKAHVYIPSNDTYTKSIRSFGCSQPIIAEHKGVPYENELRHSRHSHRHHHHMFAVQTIKDGVISKANCTAIDELPFIHQPSETVSEITFAEGGKEPSEVGGINPNDAILFIQPISIIYDASLNTPDESWEKTATDDIIQLLDFMYQDRDANKADLYLQLKHKLNMVSNIDNLEKQIIDSSSSNDKPLPSQFAINMVRDAASEIGTEEAIVYVANLISNGGLSQGAETGFFLHLHRHKNATLRGLQALQPLVNEALGKFQNESILSTIKFAGKKRIRQLILATSAYISNFCDRDPECGDYPEYEQLVNQLAQFGTSNDVRVFPAAFEALGNVQHLPAAAVKLVKEILTDDSFGITTALIKEKRKLHAFDAFRKDPCQPDLKKIARDILENAEKSSEMRMTAYLAVSQCADEEDLKVIDGIFQKEPTSTLSSFIASHIYNVMDSQSPSKNYLKNSLLSQIGIPETVPAVHNEPLANKYMEFSTFHPERNRGFSLDGYLFFGEGGEKTLNFALMNVTTDLYGKSYNHLQIGLSWRFAPNVEKYTRFSLLKRVMPYNIPTWINRILPLLGPDSFFRKDGITISMACDIVEFIKVPGFFDKHENPNTDVVSIDVVKPFTLVSHELTIPTVSGLPLTFSTEFAFLPIVSVNHSGDPNGLGFRDLLFKWDDASGTFKHNSTSDKTFVAKFSVDVGKGTPVQMSQQATAKLHFNHSIGYESSKNSSSIWNKKIDFPDNTIWSQRISLDRELYMEVDGKKLQSWPIFGDMNHRQHPELFSLQGLGIKLSGKVINDDEAYDIIIKAEKAEENFSGYSMEISTDGDDYSRIYDIKFKANGLSTNDILELEFNYTNKNEGQVEGTDDKPTFGIAIAAKIYRNGNLPFGARWEYASIDDQPSPQSQLDFGRPRPRMLSPLTFGLISRSTYKFKVNCIRCIIDGPEESRLFESTLGNGIDNVSIAIEFDGPLKDSFGTLEGYVALSEPSIDYSTGSPISQTREQTLFSALLKQESSIFGKSKIFSELVEVNENFDFKTIVEFAGTNHELSAFIEPRSVYQNYNDTKLLSAGEKFSTEISYKKNNGETQHTLWLGFDEGRDGFDGNSYRVQGNSTLSFISTQFDNPFMITFFHETNMDGTSEVIALDGIMRRKMQVFVEAFGQKQVNLESDAQYFEKKMVENDRCISGFMILVYPYNRSIDDDSPPDYERRCVSKTVQINLNVMEQLKMHANYSNVDPYAIMFNVGGFYHSLDVSGDISGVISVSPETECTVIKKHVEVYLNNVPRPGVKWISITDAALDFSNRTWDMNSKTNEDETAVAGSVRTWTTTGHAAWPSCILDGESTLDIKHTEPNGNGIDVTVVNTAESKGNSEIGIFNNNLTTLISHFSSNYMALPPSKQFVWLLSSDGTITEEEKKTLDYVIVSNSDMKLEVLGQSETSVQKEIFSLKDHFRCEKSKDVMVWNIMGWMKIRLFGKEKAAGSYKGSIDFLPTSSDHNEIDFQPDSGNTSVVPVKMISSSHTNSEKEPLSKIKLRWNLDAWFEQEHPTLRNNTFKQTYISEFTPHMTSYEDKCHFAFISRDIAFGNVIFSVDANTYKKIIFQDLTHFSKAGKAIVVVNNKTSSYSDSFQINGPFVSLYANRDHEQDAWLVDFALGLYEEKHQHKFNFRSNSYSSEIEHQHEEDHPHPHPPHHHHHHHHHQYPRLTLPHTNFNVTISRR